MAEIKDWDVAAANNNDPSPDGAPEGMAPSGVNDVIRENMAVLARWKGDNDGTLDSGGSSNAYTLTPNGTYSAYSRGDTFTFEANHTNTGSATLNVSSLGAKTIKDMLGNTLSPGSLTSGGVYSVVYDGTDFLLKTSTITRARTTWTPLVTFGGGSTGLTFTTNNGFYERIGDLVYFSAVLVLSAKGSSAGDAKVTNLPLSVRDALAGTTIEGLCSVAFASNMASLASPITANVLSDDSIDLRDWGATGTSNLTEANFTDTSTLHLVGWYATDA